MNHVPPHPFAQRLCSNRFTCSSLPYRTSNFRQSGHQKIKFARIASRKSANYFALSQYLLPSCLFSMPSKSSTSKRKASVSAIENKENKAACTSNSCDTPTSRKGVPCYSHLGLYFIFSFCYINTVEETTKRATRINRGQGGHAYQLGIVKGQPWGLKGLTFGQIHQL